MTENSIEREREQLKSYYLHFQGSDANKKGGETVILMYRNVKAAHHQVLP